MRGIKESYERFLQLSRTWKIASHYQLGEAAIRTNPYVDFIIAPDNKHRFLSAIGKTKANASQVVGKVRANLGPWRVSRRNYQRTPQEKSNKPLPRLLYIQNPLVWISNKLDFRYLRLKWDPLFTEADFTRGARQAISTVTNLVSMNKFDSMKPLLTKNALLNLRRDVEISWADEVRRNIALAPEDVQLIIPRKLHFRQSTEQKLLERGYRPTAAIITANKTPDKKFCDIDVLFIGLKYLDTSRFNQMPLAFVDIIARFHRNYSDGIPPDWTISAFKVRRFNLIPPKQE